MKTNLQRVREHRERKRAMKLWSDVSSAIQKQIYEDLKFSLETAENGNLLITWDIGRATEDFLQGYAAAKGLTFDQLMGWFNRYVLTIHKEQPEVYQQSLQRGQEKLRGEA